MFFLLDGIERFGTKELAFFQPRLSAQRKKKVESLRFLPDKIASASVFLLLRCMLAEIGENDCEFGFSAENKPYLLSRADVRFNMSHDRKGVCVCLSDRGVGADVQELFPYEKALAERILSPRERVALDRRTDKDRFLTKLWTLKESYAKKTGEGLAVIQNTDFSEANEGAFFLGGDYYLTGEKGDLFYSVCSSSKEDVRFLTTDEFLARVAKLPLL